VEVSAVERRQPLTSTPRVSGRDAGATAVARLIGHHAIDGGSARVGVRRLRNQSHSTPSEFNAFRRRLADLLASADARMEFVTADGEPVDYELHGTAYLVSRDGTDQWELYLSLRPAGSSWTVWKASGPTRVLRQPVPGARQVVTWPDS
jgi:hypothetical protein